MQPDIPVVITNFNRFEPFLQQVKWLRTLEGLSQIHILDNASTYPPLLDYYSANPDNLSIHRMSTNTGHLAFKNNILSITDTKDRILVTDPDLIPYPTTPSDILQKMHRLLDTHLDTHKIGAGLGIKDIPDCYPFANDVRRHESNLLGAIYPDGSRKSLVDTTFALYRCPEAFGNWRDQAIRTVHPYMLKHVDWYVDPENLSEEYIYYLEHCTESASYAWKLKDWMTRLKINWKKRQ